MSKIFVSMEFRENRIDIRDPENAKHFHDVKIFEHAQMSEMQSISEHTRKFLIFDESLDKFAKATSFSDCNGDF